MLAILLACTISKVQTYKLSPMMDRPIFEPTTSNQVDVQGWNDN